jgi:hypothetical protein
MEVVLMFVYAACGTKQAAWGGKLLSLSLFAFISMSQLQPLSVLLPDLPMFWPAGRSHRWRL